MKVLILVIYSRNEAYDKMLEVQRKYMHNYKDVEVYFMESCFLHNEPVFIQDDMSRVRIKEDNKTILFKTLATIECCIMFIGDTLILLFEQIYLP